MHASLKNLSQDHRTIEQELDLLEQAAHELLARKPLEAGLLRQCVSSLSSFLDGCHWRKEEELLFPALSAARAFVGERPIEELGADHVRVRRAFNEVKAALAQMDSGHPGGGWAVAVALAGWYTPLRTHLHAEEHAAFPAAERTLKLETLEELAEAFRRIDAERGDTKGMWELLQRRLERASAGSRN